LTHIINFLVPTNCPLESGRVHDLGMLDAIKSRNLTVDKSAKIIHLLYYPS